jgi:hypothetical protein
MPGDGPLLDILGIPLPASPGDIVINEVLFNPRTGGTDFIELLNASDRFIDMKNWRLLIYEEGIPDEVIELAPEAFFIQPNTHTAFTASKQVIVDHYPYSSNSSRIFNVAGFPNLPSDSAVLVLKNETYETIDSIKYTEDFHFSLLSDLNGVSLERLNTESSVSNDFSWASASESVGFATPGNGNSQQHGILSQGKLTVQPKLFTPNNDGDNDRLFIRTDFEGSGWSYSLSIFDDRGRLVRNLASNRWAGNQDVLFWDGLDERGKRVSIGQYILWVEAFNSDGRKQRFVELCVLGERL